MRKVLWGLYILAGCGFHERPCLSCVYASYGLESIIAAQHVQITKSWPPISQYESLAGCFSRVAPPRFQMRVSVDRQ